MSTTEIDELSEVLNRIKAWPLPRRLTLARRIVETMEIASASTSPRKGSLKDVLGILKTDAPPPTEEQCRAILDEELLKQHMK